MTNELKQEILYRFRKSMADKPPIYWIGMKLAMEIIRNFEREENGH